MSISDGDGAARPVRVALGRAVLFLAFWLMSAGYQPADLPVGLLAAAAATWTSLKLLPPTTVELRLPSLLIFSLHFLGQSVTSGIEVARIAFDPRLPLRPGFVTYPVSVPPGLARNTFATITSLLPGSVPADEVDGALVYHCLDITQPVVEQLSAEERTLAKALVSEQRDA